MEYLHGDREWFLDKFSHVEYKRLKKVLKNCRTCKALHDSCSAEQDDKDESCTAEQEYKENIESSSQICQCESCPGDQYFLLSLVYLNFFRLLDQLLCWLLNDQYHQRMNEKGVDSILDQLRDNASVISHQLLKQIGLFFYNCYTTTQNFY